MKKLIKDKKVNDKNGIIAMITLQTMFVIFATIISFIFVEYMSRYFYNNDDNSYNIIAHAFGLIIPMCVLLGAVNFYISKILLKCVSTLIDGIDKIANGDFSARLDEKKAGPLPEVFKNFNKMGEELENVEILKNDFLNNFSHEFKTPITSINGFASLLLQTKVSEKERNEYLQIIADESARLANLANSTILLSKLDSQAIVQNKKQYSLDEQLRQCAIITSSAWQSKNINLCCELDACEYYGNYELMQQLWLNLINNAIKYTPIDGNIVVSLKKQANNITVSVSDNGIGMNSETVRHLFEKYYQFDKSHVKSGLGLGLAIAKKIVDLANGKIEVASQENLGSDFKVTLYK